MIRVALVTVAVTAAPALTLAQAPPAPPAPPAAPAPLAAPAPAAAPAAPLPPAAPVPFHYDSTAGITLPPIDIDLSALEYDLAALHDLRIDVPFVDVDMPRIEPFHFDFDFDFPDVDYLTNQMQWAQADTAGVQKQAEAAREAARQAADQARTMRFAGDAYNGGLNALQQRQYDRAIEAFDRVIQATAPRADAALYWKAFAEFRLARTNAALQTIAQLQKTHPQSRYLSDARVLEAELRKQTGQRVDPAQLDDDEIKLLAIQGLERTEQVVPLLEGVLSGANSLNVKKRALYVLALRPDDRARSVLLNYAKGGGNPDLQFEAVRLLVSRRDAQTTGAVLRDLYESTSDTAVRRVIIDAYRSRARGRGDAAAAPATNATAQELVTLYQRETDLDLRRQIVGVLIALDATEQVSALVRSEKDPQVRSRVISALGGRRSEATTQTLVAMYPTFSDTPSREAIINALASLQNAEALITLARSESNVTLKTRIVRHLSEMAPRSKAASDYLMDVIR
jgi:hypothetical protein